MTNFIDSVESFATEKAEDLIIDDAMDTVESDDSELINDEDQGNAENAEGDESGTNDREGQDDDDSANTSDFEEEDDTAEESDFEEQDDVDEEDTVEEIELDEDFYGEYSDAEPIEEGEPIDIDQYEEEALIEGDSGEFEEEPLLDGELSDGELLEEVGADLDIDDFSDFLDELFTDEPLDQEEEEGILGIDYWAEFGVEEPFEELGFDTDTLYFS